MSGAVRNLLIIGLGYRWVSENNITFKAVCLLETFAAIQEGYFIRTKVFE